MIWLPDNVLHLNQYKIHYFEMTFQRSKFLIMWFNPLLSFSWLYSVFDFMFIWINYIFPPPILEDELYAGHPWQWKNCKKWGKRGEKSGKQRKNQEEKAKIGKVLSLCPSWQIGLATLLRIKYTAGVLLQKLLDEARFISTLFQIFFLTLNAPDCEKVPFAHIVLDHICTVSVF